MRRTVLIGQPSPLGATYDGDGTNFAIYSSVARRVVLCLFDPSDRETQVDLDNGVGHAWHVYVPGIAPDARYAYRIYGAGSAADRLVLDPYARALTSDVRPTPSLMRNRVDPPGRSVISGPLFAWGNDRRPETPWTDTTIYECHVKSETYRCREIPLAQRGTYAGLAHPFVLEHVLELGATAVLLLPILAGGDRDYWGFSPISYFAPNARYASEREPLAVVDEVKHMVRAFHQAGLEVIATVPITHTAGLRGIDDAAYYDDGGGDVLQLRHPSVVRLVMDALRYWVVDMHVDGFRFDLAAWAERDPARLAAFFDLVHQDPVLPQVKLHADGAELPPLWTRGNGRYRDWIRDYWRGEPGRVAARGARFTRSHDRFARPGASLDFVTAHDGFTLRDLVSYDRKHNEANGQRNRDGDDANHAWNCGVEGPTLDPEVAAVRSRQQQPQPARDADFVARRADAVGWRRVWPDPKRK